MVDENTVLFERDATNCGERAERYYAEARRTKVTATTKQYVVELQRLAAEYSAAARESLFIAIEKKG